MTQVKIFGAHDERTKEQMARCMQYGSVVGGVLCADGHLGYAQPVGGVIAYDEHISVSGVGFDIACGNMAVKLDLPKKAIADRVEPILTNIASNVSFGLGRANKEKVEHELFDSPLWNDCKVIEPLKTMARQQLGTVGSGNHYVDLFADEDGFVWIGVHFGSRGLGHKTATAFLKLAGVKSAAAAATLYSTVHGAGRVMSRTEARGRFVKDPATGKRMRQPGRVRHDEMQAWLRGKGVRLIGGGLDEAPQAYRRLPDVLAHHAGTVKIEHTLRPFAVVMAGADVFDPFKD